MEEEFEFGFTEDPKFSVERYEEMIRNHDQYFFDAQAFENIIDYYIEKNDPPKALQVAADEVNIGVGCLEHCGFFKRLKCLGNFIGNH